MNISVSSASELPLYKQLYDGISGAIIRGELREGELLPPIRTVSQDLRISVISVKRAWEELERDGFINTAVGRGCFVAHLSAEKISELRRKMLSDKFMPAVNYAKSLGVGYADVTEIIKEIFE